MKTCADHTRRHRDWRTPHPTARQWARSTVSVLGSGAWPTYSKLSRAWWGITAVLLYRVEWGNGIVYKLKRDVGVAYTLSLSPAAYLKRCTGKCDL